MNPIEQQGKMSEQIGNVMKSLHDTKGSVSTKPDKKNSPSFAMLLNKQTISTHENKALHEASTLAEKSLKNKVSEAGRAGDQDMAGTAIVNGPQIQIGRPRGISKNCGKNPAVDEEIPLAGSNPVGEGLDPEESVEASLQGNLVTMTLRMGKTPEQEAVAANPPAGQGEKTGQSSGQEPGGSLLNIARDRGPESDRPVPGGDVSSSFGNAGDLLNVQKCPSTGNLHEGSVVRSEGASSGVIDDPRGPSSPVGIDQSGSVSFGNLRQEAVKNIRESGTAEVLPKGAVSGNLRDVTAEEPARERIGVETISAAVKKDDGLNARSGKADHFKDAILDEVSGKNQLPENHHPVVDVPQTAGGKENKTSEGNGFSTHGLNPRFPDFTGTEHGTKTNSAPQVIAGNQNAAILQQNASTTAKNDGVVNTSSGKGEHFSERIVDEVSGKNGIPENHGAVVDALQTAAGREKKVYEGREFPETQSNTRAADVTGMIPETKTNSAPRMTARSQGETSFALASATAQAARTDEAGPVPVKKGPVAAPPIKTAPDVETAEAPKTARAFSSNATAAVFAVPVDFEKDKSRPVAPKSRISYNMAGSVMDAPGDNTVSRGGKQTEVVGLPAGVKAQAVIDQIIDARQQMQNDTGRIKITLTPPSLGTVNLDVVVRQNRVEVIMTADHSAVQQLLQSCGEEIKSALQRQDMKVDSFQVLLHQNNSEGNQQQPGFWTATQEHNRGQSGRYAVKEGEKDMPSVAEHIPESQHRGLVSVFA